MRNDLLRQSNSVVLNGNQNHVSGTGCGDPDGRFIHSHSCIDCIRQQINKHLFETRRVGTNAQVLVGRIDINRHSCFFSSVRDNLHAILDTAIDRNTLQIDRAFSGELLQLTGDPA